MKVRIIYQNDGTVTIVHPAPKSKSPLETEDEWLLRVFTDTMEQNGWVGLDYKDVDESELPERDEDRNAWVRDDKGVKVDTDKAEKMRKEREEAELIAEEKERILEEQAIANLKKSGKIPA